MVLCSKLLIIRFNDAYKSYHPAGAFTLCPFFNLSTEYPLVSIGGAEGDWGFGSSCDSGFEGIFIGGTLGGLTIGVSPLGNKDPGDIGFSSADVFGSCGGDIGTSTPDLFKLFFCFFCYFF